MSDSKEPKQNPEDIMREYTLKFQKLMSLFQMLSQMDPESFDSMYKSFYALQMDIVQTMQGLDQLRETIAKFDPEDDDEYDEPKPRRSRKN